MDGGLRNYFIARAMPDNSRDNSLDGNGVVRVGMSTVDGGALAMTLAGGKPAIGGYAYLPGIALAVLRLQSDLIFANGLE